MKNPKFYIFLLIALIIIGAALIYNLNILSVMNSDREIRHLEDLAADENIESTIDTDFKSDMEEEIELSIQPLPMRDISSMDLIKEFKVGWSLGNTLDATEGGASLMSEISWGNPKTTKEVFDKVKDAGFDIVRIPVSWGNHLGPEPDYVIHEVWLDRVNEVVDYAIDRDLFVILNIHHEDWHFPSYNNLEQAKTILTLVWTQIAERFKAYDEYLIFEGMNEPRMIGTPLEWTGGNAEARDVINQLNKSFIDTIRSSTGNNPNRHLMIPSYAASSDPKTWEDFIVPIDDKVIVSIHAYTPYNFALNKNGRSEWSLDNAKDRLEIDNLMHNLNDFFISKGQPVIIGEFGAMDKDNINARAAWVKYYIEKAAEIGVPCIWWDNGAFVGNGELFGLLERRSGVWQHQEVLEAMMEGLD